MNEVARLADRWNGLPTEVRSSFLRRTTSEQEQIHSGVVGSLGPLRVLRPMLLADSAVLSLGYLTTELARILLQTVLRRARTAAELASALGSEWPTEAIGSGLTPVDGSALVSMRPDVVLQDGVPKFLEFNIDSAVGATYHVDELAARFGRALHESGGQGAFRRPDSAVTSRFTAMKRSLGLRDGALVVIPVSAGGPADIATPAKFVKWLEPMTRKGSESGLRVRACDVAELHLSPVGDLILGDEAVDAVFRLTVPPALDAGAGRNALVEAARTGRVALHTHELTWLMSDKRLMAWMHDDLDLMPASDADLVARHVPRTKVFGDQHRVGSESKDECVLKPGNGYGGADVFVGRTLTSNEWQRAAATAATAGNYVVQSYVPADAVEMDFLDLRDGSRVSDRVRTSLSPFVFGRKVSGILVRNQSPAGGELLNAPHGAQINTVLLATNGEG